MSSDRGNADRVQSALRELVRYYAAFRVMPSYAELALMTGFVSKSSVSGLVWRLKRDGFLTATPNGRLAPTDKFLSFASGA